ncbi:MAG: ABC-F family ATP-binding cassette domain-containing protein [Lachnospiraceae bacterium]|nr:ABC-F family ATP-binding cassette domain-containing protein [Lachnospiraceae bacterium]
MLQVKNLTIAHKKDLREITKEFSFVINDGDKAAMIGEEGNGKSTVLKLLYAPELVEDYVEWSGTIVRDNIVAGYLAQELSVEEKGMTVYEFMCAEPAFFDVDAGELAHITAQLGIAAELPYAEQPVGALSGGEKIKVQLLRILCRRPNLLLLDEPSNDIDIATLEWLEKFILEFPYAVLYISHDEVLLENTANMILHMELIKRKTEPKHTVFRCGYTDYIQQREAGIVRQERLANKEAEEYAKQMERYRRIQQRVEHEQNVITRQNPSGGRLLKKKMHAVKSMERRFEREAENMTKHPDYEEAIFFRFQEENLLHRAKRVLEFELPELYVGEQTGETIQKEALSLGQSLQEATDPFGVSGQRLLAKDIRLAVTGPERICIIGKNGAGKTTLLRQIAKQMLQRTDLSVAYMPQNYEELLDLTKTPVEFLQKSGDKEEETRIRTYLGSMKYTIDEMNHPIAELSGGQKAKVLLLSMSMNGSSVLILDEPTRNFSPLSCPVIRELLRNYHGAIISVSHDRKYIREVCTKVYELTEGGLVEVQKK